MARKYQPCELTLRLENVILDDVSDKTVAFARDNRTQLETLVVPDPAAGLVHVTPCFYWEELADYSLIFSKMLRFTSGRLLLRNYAMKFMIRDGVFYTPNGADYAGGELFTDANILEHGSVISLRFDENVSRITLTYEELPEEDEEEG